MWAITRSPTPPSPRPTATSRSRSSPSSARPEAKVQIKKHEHQVQSHQLKIDDLKVKLNQAKKNDEYKAIQNQIAHDQAAIGKLEDELLEAYGATETQGITVVHWLTERVGLIGLPLPGITLKLVPNGQKLEVRVKGARYRIRTRLGYFGR